MKILNSAAAVVVLIVFSLGSAAHAAMPEPPAPDATNTFQVADSGVLANRNNEDEQTPLPDTEEEPQPF